MSKPALCAIAILSIAGCTARYQVSNLSGASAGQLERSKVVFVTVPADGAYGQTQYPGSGQIVAQGVATAFAPTSPSVHVAERPGTIDEAMAAARALKATYLIQPTIVQWEQRATEWSGRPSRMTIRVNVVDVATGRQLSSSVIEGRSRIVSFTSTTPESLLNDPLADYVRGLY